jgi:hypothetical protein
VEALDDDGIVWEVYGSEALRHRSEERLPRKVDHSAAPAPPWNR